MREALAQPAEYIRSLDRSSSISSAFLATTIRSNISEAAQRTLGDLEPAAAISHRGWTTPIHCDDEAQTDGPSCLINQDLC